MGTNRNKGRGGSVGGFFFQPGDSACNTVQRTARQTEQWRLNLHVERDEEAHKRLEG